MPLGSIECVRDGNGVAIGVTLLEHGFCNRLEKHPVDQRNSDKKMLPYRRPVSLSSDTIWPEWVIRMLHSVRVSSTGSL